ncbi:MAG: family 78 glycoside hydrolase catalytic domain [Clostridia bacterium]|nr:family 78 glycoside hydrolase catalytic domain [Clostridia bacterium]
MKATRIETEFLRDPIGIGVRNPRFTWQCEGGKKQTAYRVVCLSGGDTVWDSGKVLSADMYVVCPQAFSSRQRVEIIISLWDEEDNEGEKTRAFFEMGLLSQKDFRAKWIAGNYRVNKKNRYPVDCFKKKFFVESCQKARLYITACGLYEAKLNGKKAGEFVLAPGHTDYGKRIQLQTYDVTDLVKTGENVLTVELADGWYRGSCGAWGRKNQYGTQTKLYAQLEIADEAGKITLVGTDETWGWSCDGPIRFADNKDGEIVDARKAPTYSGKAKVTSCAVLPTASDNVAVCEHETFKPTVIRTPAGKTVLNFGQNIAGYVSFRLKAKEGQTIKLRFGEMFDKEGEFTQKNIQCANKKRTKVTPLQQVIYTAKEGVNEYKTKFAIFGFQYVSVETDIEWRPEDFTAIAVYSDMRDTLSFSCSHELINKLVESTRWSAKNNHADVPTDCPTRERHGWTGDAQIFVNTASYFFNYESMARKYIGDMSDGQRKNGCYRQITPKGGIDFYMNSMDGSAGWSDAAVLICYRIFRKYGDKRILEGNYDDLRRYALYKIKTIGKRSLTSLPTGLARKYAKMISNYGQSYGEWAEPADIKAFSIGDFVSPHPEETTAYIVYMLEYMKKIAELLGKKEDAEYYEKYADRARIGYQHLVETKKNTLDTDRQAKLVRPLYMGLLNKEQTDFAKKRLLKALDNYGWRLGTGFLSTPFILYVLADMNIEYAYRLLESEEMPGWLFMPRVGANTIWESWEGTEAQGGVASLDHYSKGAVCEWLFDTMCGIKVAGERKFVLAPKPGGSITYAECAYDSVYGKVSVRWERDEEKIVYVFDVPVNTVATIVLPDGEREVGAGRHQYVVKRA